MRIRILASTLLIGASLFAGAGSAAASTPSTVGGDESGYVATGATYTSVSATWTVPATTCAANRAMAIWTGLDGVDDSTVEQLGIEISCVSGGQVIQGWYEAYPAAPVYFNNTIGPGDTLTATISAPQNVYTFTLSDLTKGWTKTATKTLVAEKSSAEVLVECDGTCPAFHQVAFTKATVNGHPLANANPAVLDGTPGTTSAITNGENFTVTQLTT